MLIIIRINYASKDLKIHFEGGAERYSRGFYSASGAGVGSHEWRSLAFSNGKLQTFPGQQHFPCPLMGVGELCQCSMFCDLHLASGNRNTKRKGRSVTDRQPLSQLIFDDLIDNKTNNFGGGCLCFAIVGMGRGSWDREDALSFLSICQALSQRSAREERVINRLEVISDVSVFLPCFQVIMFAGSRPPGSLPSY